MSNRVPNYCVNRLSDKHKTFHCNSQSSLDVKYVIENTILICILIIAIYLRARLPPLHAPRSLPRSPVALRQRTNRRAARARPPRAHRLPRVPLSLPRTPLTTHDSRAACSALRLPSPVSFTPATMENKAPFRIKNL